MSDGPLSEGQEKWLSEHIGYLKKRIIDEAKSIADRAGHAEIEPCDLSDAVRRFAPGVRFDDEPQAGFWQRVSLSISGITLISALLAISFGILGGIFLKSGGQASAGYFDIMKLFGGAVVGSTGIGIASSLKSTKRE